MCVYYVCVYVHINILGSLCCTPVNQHTSIKKKQKMSYGYTIVEYYMAMN